MNSGQVEIFEFSTGIKPEQLADGKWISRGFTGQYMNNTFPNQKIPLGIERSIVNRELSLTESTLRDDFTFSILSRLIVYPDLEESWSVVAFASKGKDEFGRFLTVYRYYAVQDPGDGEGILWILNWLQARVKQRHQIVFHPFDFSDSFEYLYTTASIHPPTEQEIAELITHQQDLWRVQSGVLLLDRPFTFPSVGQMSKLFNDCVGLNTIAKYHVSHSDSNLILAWAYMTSNLENPSSFSVIHVLDNQTLAQLLQSISETDRMMSATRIDAQAIKSTLNRLLNRRDIRSEDVKMLEEFRLDNNIPVAFWEKLFDAEGASKAISQKLYTPQMLKLQLIQIRFLPDRIGRFVNWIQPIAKEQQESCVSFFNLYNQYARHYSSFDPVPGLTNCLAELMSNRMSPGEFLWVLQSDLSYWQGDNQFIKIIYEDLTKIEEFSKEARQSKHMGKSDELDKFLNLSGGFWNPYTRALRGRQIATEYDPLLSVFVQMSEYKSYDITSTREFAKILIVFTQLVKGSVYTPVMRKVFRKNVLNSRPTLFEIKIIREYTKAEIIVEGIRKSIPNFANFVKGLFQNINFLGVVFILVLSGLLYALLRFISPDQTPIPLTQPFATPTSPSSTKASTPNHTPSPGSSSATQGPQKFKISNNPALELKNGFNNKKNQQYGEVNRDNLRKIIDKIYSENKIQPPSLMKIEEALVSVLQKSADQHGLYLEGDTKLLAKEIDLNTSERLIQAVIAYEKDKGDNFSQDSGVIYNIKNRLAKKLECEIKEKLAPPDNQLVPSSCKE